MAVATQWTIWLKTHTERIDIVEEDGRWAVRWRLSCWTRRGEWVFEPLRAARSEEFLAETRWATDEEALAEGRKAAAEKLAHWQQGDEARRERLARRMGASLPPRDDRGSGGSGTR